MSRLDDGFSTLITFAENATVKLWEKEVTPPAVSGGGPIDITTMKNSTFRTQAPKSLKTTGQVSVAAAYDPAVLDEILAMINVNQEITVTFPDGETWVFWGWIDEFTPPAHTEGEQPTADLVIQPSNLNDSDEETAPAFLSASSSA